MTATQRSSIGWATAALGLTGLVCGVVALVAGMPFMGLLAGILAVGAGAAGFSAAHLDPPTGETSPTTKPVRVTDSDATPKTRIDDELTGLRAEAYFMAAAADRIEAARRYLRPVALMLLEVRSANGRDVSPVDAAAILTATLRDADLICRRDDDSFAVLVEDTPETGALIVVERLRPALRGRLGDVTVHAGLACYPAHGLDFESIWSLAASALVIASDSDRDTTEVPDSV
jgi:diguanylate cyclase (GGDEF)-like protein